MAGARKNRRSTSEKTAAFTPMPSVSVSTTTAVNAGVRRNPRAAYVRSCQSASRRGANQTSRARSSTRSASLARRRNQYDRRRRRRIGGSSSQGEDGVDRLHHAFELLPFGG